ncbi:MAG: 2-phosphosulfolactate phosphatase [Rhodobiaceae bacterium]|nr:putative 2-phosphosulfolactate phosphatase [Rhodobiaceae bacterium]MCR9240259.1 2-phosphosulfolactate phosphatase [Rhodobiaceae bacterium]
MVAPNLTVSRHKGHGAIDGTHDIAVVIDVIRAFTFAKTAFDNGAERLLLAKEVDTARALAAANPNSLLAGEVDTLPIDGFDFGNSPAQIAGLDLMDCTIVHRTSNGTQMAIKALECASHVLVTGLSNAQATAKEVANLAENGAKKLLLVATHPTGDEDVACGDLLLSLLGQEGGITPDQAFDRTQASEAAEKFLDPAQPDYAATDLVHVLAMDPPAYAMRVALEADVPTVRKTTLKNV